MQIISIIPARLGSARLPNKILLPIKGKPLLYWVYRACRQVKAFKEVLVATDSQKVKQLVQSWGGEAVLTSVRCRNGTERIAEIALKLKKRTFYYVNVQGDQPFIAPRMLHKFVDWLETTKPEVGTIVTSLPADESENSNVVKVVLGENGRCLYFSRLLVPFARDGKAIRRYKHIGVYAYRKRALERYVSVKPPVAERAEKLEQLRFLACGIELQALIVRSNVQSIDSPQDVSKFSKKERSFSARVRDRYGQKS